VSGLQQAAELKALEGTNSKLQQQVDRLTEQQTQLR